VGKKHLVGGHVTALIPHSQTSSVVLLGKVYSLLTYYLVWFLYQSPSKVSVLRPQPLPRNRNFALIEKKNNFFNEMVLSKWKYVIAESRINKTYNFAKVEQPHFKDLEVVESKMNWDNNLKIIHVLWLRLWR
jgi:hypothetical protein